MKLDICHITQSSDYDNLYGLK